MKSIIEEMIESWRKKPRGPIPRISPTKLLVALKIIEKENPIGRYDLAKKLNLTNGTVRGMLERLKEKKLIQATKRGCIISEKGREAIREFLERKGIVMIKELERKLISKLAPGEKIYGIQIANAKEKVEDGLKQRDEAVKAGAHGATTLIYTNKKLLFPKTLEETEEIYKQESEYLKRQFKLKEGDVLILCWAKNHVSAIEGAINAALTLAS